MADDQCSHSALIIQFDPHYLGDHIWTTSLLKPPALRDLPIYSNTLVVCSTCSTIVYTDWYIFVSLCLNYCVNKNKYFFDLDFNVDYLFSEIWVCLCHWLSIKHDTGLIFSKLNGTPKYLPTLSTGHSFILSALPSEIHQLLACLPGLPMLYLNGTSLIFQVPNIVL